MDCTGWIKRIRDAIDDNEPSVESNTALVEALCLTAGAIYATTVRVPADFIDELGNAAYHALQDKAEEIVSRN